VLKKLNTRPGGASTLPICVCIGISKKLGMGGCPTENTLPVLTSHSRLKYMYVYSLEKLKRMCCLGCFLEKKTQQLIVLFWL